MRTREMRMQAPRRAQKLTGRFFENVRLPTVHGRRQFSVLKPHRAAHVYVTLEERRFQVRTKEDCAWTTKEVTVPDGAILLQRTGARARPIFAIYGSIYDARRGLLYGIAGYDDAEIGGNAGEMPVMTAEQAAFDDACVLLKSWSRLDAIERIALAQTLSGFVARHEGARDEDKAAAVEEIDAFADLTDSIGRVNPRAAERVVAKAKRLLESRSARIGRIHPRESLRLAVVQGEITLAIEVAQDLRARIAGTFLPAAARPHEEFRKHAITLADRLARQARRLALWKAQPFATDRAMLSALLTTAAFAFGEMRKEDAHEALTKAKVQLDRVLARHDLLIAVEHIAILPADPKRIPKRIDDAKRLLRDFYHRYRLLFPESVSEESLPDWRKDLRRGWSELKAGDLLPAKEHLAFAAARLVA